MSTQSGSSGALSVTSGQRSQSKEFNWQKEQSSTRRSRAVGLRPEQLSDGPRCNMRRAPVTPNADQARSCARPRDQRANFVTEDAAGGLCTALASEFGVRLGNEDQNEKN